MGAHAGSIVSNGNTLDYSDTSGTLTLANGSTLSVSGSLIDSGGTIQDAGGSLIVGGAFSANSSGTFGMPVDIVVTGGGLMQVTGAASGTAMLLDASGTGSRITVGGTVTAGGGGSNYGLGASANANTTVAAQSGGVVRIGGLVINAPTSGFSGASGVMVDTSSVVEIGSVGSAATGAMTIDAGQSITTNATAALNAAIVDNGTVFVNAGTTIVNGNVTGTGTLQIAGSATLSLNGTTAAGTTIGFTARNAALSIGNGYSAVGTSYAYRPYAISSTLMSLQGGDTIVVGTTLTGISFTRNTSPGMDTLKLMDSTGTVETLAIADPYGNYSGSNFLMTTSAGSSTVTVNACFATGTRIATADGAIAVEALRVGDLVRTASGAMRPVRWIGHRRVDMAAQPDPGLVQPVRIRADAMAPGVPCADLLLSPDHAVFVDGVLVAVHRLVNGQSIVVDPVDTITYWHVELDSHDILLAEGMAVESYLDTGNRDSFDGVVTRLWPDFRGSAEIYAALGAAPLVTDAAVVHGIWQRLAGREGVAAHGRRVVPRLAVRMPGGGVSASTLRPGRHVFALSGATTVVLESDASRPSDRAPWGGDRRRLGVAVSRLRADGVELGLDTGHGWHGAENENGRRWRWTDGAAEIVVPAGARVLEVTIEAVA